MLTGEICTNSTEDPEILPEKRNTLNRLQSLPSNRGGEAPSGYPNRGFAELDQLMTTKVEILGIPFQGLSYADALSRIRGMVRGRSRHQIVLANAHTLNLACCSPPYRHQLQEASVVLRDGTGVKLASILAGKKLDHNFVGTDFVPRLISDLSQEATRVFLFGAKPGVAEAAARSLTLSCPQIEVVGCQHGYLPGQWWTEAIVHRVNTVKPHILLVALGNPLQELWIAENLARLEVRVAIGVGALFDYLAGKVSRAPLWMRQIGFEWLYRLLVEPRRLWRRYLIGNFEFLLRVVADQVATRSGAPGIDTK